MSEKKLTHASSIKKGSYILVDDEPCVVKADPQISRPGKHGHAKVRIKAQNIFTGSTKEIVKPGHDSVEVPIILKKQGQIISSDDDSVQMMDMETFETLTVEMKNIEEEVRDKLSDGITVMFWEVMGKILIKQIQG